MCLGNLFQQFYNIADSIVAGKFIGVNALAAIGSTGSLMFFVTGWLNGLSSGFAIIVAQMFGAKKFDRMRHYVAMSIYLMAAFSIVMTIGFSLANKPILHLMNSPEEVFGDVTAYMGIIYAGLIITGAYNALAAFLRALGDSKSPLYFLIISAVINVILDVVFIVAFGSLEFLWDCSFRLQQSEPLLYRARSIFTDLYIWPDSLLPVRSRIFLPQYLQPSVQL